MIITINGKDFKVEAVDGTDVMDFLRDALTDYGKEQLSESARARVSGMTRTVTKTEPVTPTAEDIQTAAKNAATRGKKEEVKALIAEYSGGGKAKDVPGDKIEELIKKINAL
ncbi:MAG: hypothetical protein SOW44_01390 [Porphyromonas sp.]|nr:hypothetical protein [Bacteroidales bacterium]MDY3099987.1 hypothetical protein [Porphyromonas sp.]